MLHYIRNDDGRETNTMSEYRKYAQYSKKKEIKQTRKLSKEGKTVIQKA